MDADPMDATMDANLLSLSHFNILLVSVNRSFRVVDILS